MLDSVNCCLFDTLDVHRYIPHYPQANSDTTGCLIVALYLKPSNKATIGTYQWQGNFPGDSIRYYPPLGAHQRVLRYRDTLACLTYDTVNVVNNSKPNMYLPPDTVICSGNGIRIDPLIYSGKRPFVYEWTPYTHVNDSFVQDVFYQSSRIYLKLTDSTNCYRIDSIDVLINSIPQIGQHSPYSVCTRDSFVSLSALSGSLYGVWLGTGVSLVNGEFWLDIRNLNVGSHYYSFEALNSGGNCTSKEYLEIIIHPSPTVDAVLDTGLCGGGTFVFKVLSAGGRMPYYFAWNDDNATF